MPKILVPRGVSWHNRETHSQPTHGSLMLQSPHLHCFVLVCSYSPLSLFRSPPNSQHIMYCLICLCRHLSFARILPTSAAHTLSLVIALNFSIELPNVHSCITGKMRCVSKYKGFQAIVEGHKSQLLLASPSRIHSFLGRWTQVTAGSVGRLRILGNVTLKPRKKTTRDETCTDDWGECT
jgi:hypothetical protein